jgi:hypothetical protein
MDENANPRTLDQKSHIEGRETVPEIVITEQPAKVAVEEVSEELVPVLVKR